MTFLSKRNKMCSLKVSEEEKAALVAMSRELRLPVQELLRRGGFKEGRRLLSRQRMKQGEKFSFR